MQVRLRWPCLALMGASASVGAPLRVQKKCPGEHWPAQPGRNARERNALLRGYQFHSIGKASEGYRTLDGDTTVAEDAKLCSAR